jgi:NADH-quinone oxidoreductase subunit C
VTPEEVGAALADRGAVEVAFGSVTVTVPVEDWVATVGHARDDPSLACTFFDWLSAVDEGEAGFAVVTHLWSPTHRHHLLLRTVVPRADPRLPTLTGVFAGADWHERETLEMFGVVFDGHPNPVPLLLPDGFEGHPLRKDFVLAARAAKAWPGAKEPGEGGEAPSRRANIPTGQPADWPRPVPTETTRPDP